MEDVTNNADSELFGHVCVAINGASADRYGKFHVASGGTQFQGDIREPALSVVPRLLRAIQRGEINPSTRESQRSLFEHARGEHDGHWAAAARSLSIHRSNFRQLAVRLGLK